MDAYMIACSHGPVSFKHATKPRWSMSLESAHTNRLWPHFIRSISMRQFTFLFPNISTCSFCPPLQFPPLFANLQASWCLERCKTLVSRIVSRMGWIHGWFHVGSNVAMWSCGRTGFIWERGQSLCQKCRVIHPSVSFMMGVKGTDH